MPRQSGGTSYTPQFNFAGNKIQAYNSLNSTYSFISGPFINALDYVTDITGVTDVTTQLQAAINATPAGGTLYTPAGKYNTVGGLTRSTPITIRGDNGNYSYDYNSPTNNTNGSIIYSTSGTATLFTCSATGINLIDIAFVNNSASTPTTSLGVSLTNAGDFRMTNVAIVGFYDGMFIENSGAWKMDKSTIKQPIHYGLKINNSVSGDSGDWRITNTYFQGIPSVFIRYESSGGGIITNCKFNPGPNVGRIGIAIETHIVSNTVDFIISNNSFEGFNGSGIVITKAGGVAYGNVQILGNQFDPAALITGNVISATGIANLMINDNNITEGFTNTVAAINANTIVGLMIKDNQWEGWSTKLATASLSGVVDVLLVPETQAFQEKLSGTGIVKSTAGTISYLTDNSANWNAAYSNRIGSFTTTGASGASTFTPGGALNIPNYTLAGLGGLPLTATSSFPLTGNLYINRATPSIAFINSASSNKEWDIGGSGNNFVIGDSGGNAIVVSPTDVQINRAVSLPTGSTAVTQSAGDNSIKLATTAYVDAAASAITSASVSAQTTAQTVLTKAVGGVDKVFDVSGFLTVSSASTLNLNYNLSYTDENSNVTSYNIFVAVFANGQYGANVHTIKAKAGTNIVISTNFTGSCTYNAGAYVRPLF